MGRAKCPDEIYESIASNGAKKLNQHVLSEIVLGALAGCYIGFGYSVCLMCAGGLSAELKLSQPGVYHFLAGIFGFPTGLTLCVIAGANLFTSNVLYSTVSIVEHFSIKSVVSVFRLLLVSWFANLGGSLLLAQLQVWAHIWPPESTDFIIASAISKTELSWGAALVRGILCNWLVCLAVWQATAATDVTGKVFGIWLPISAFVALGYEHCVANMFFIPMSMMLGSNISVRTYIVDSVIPVTLGNLIGGSCLVAGAYCLVYGKIGLFLTRNTPSRVNADPQV